MSARLHLLCRDALGVTCLDARTSIYRSEAWALTAEEVAALQGGRVYLHQAKSEPSYFGGSVVSAERLPAGPGEADRYALTVQSDLEGKGVHWDERGKSHGMAWSSGVIAA